MRRSHAPSLLALAERTLADEARLAPGDGVLLAVSGGPDSMAMLHVLARLAPRLQLRLAAHGVDHGLRPEAAAELELARALAARLGVPFGVTRVEVARGGNLMARARKARSAALDAARLAASAAVVATAHHADDRAETVLLRLLRGTGPAGLAVLPVRDDTRLRPLVRARRTDVLAHLARHAIAYAEDPTNADPRFTRTRVRHELLPLLRALSPRIVEHLCALADAAGAPGGAPAVVDGVRLGRAHRDALTRALRLGQHGARVALPGGQVAQVDLAAGTIVVSREPR